MLLVGAPREEDLHHLVASAGAGEGERRVLGALALGLDVALVVDQDLDDFLVAGGGGQDQRREPLLVAVF